MKNDWRARNHPAWWAFALHRVSGIALTLFIPVHFWVLGRAVDAAAFDALLRWTEQPLVKFAEWGLVTLLAAHLAAGLRILALEFLPWREWQKSLFAVGIAITVAVGAALALAL